MEQHKIDRINVLAKKAREPDGLTTAEQTERDALHKEYVAAHRDSLVAQLDRTYIVGSDGVKRPLGKKE